MSFTSIPQNLINYYNIPDRNKENPIHIGVFEWNSYITKNNMYDYYNSFMKGYSNNPSSEDFKGFIENNVEFIDYENLNNDSKVKAEYNWNHRVHISSSEASLDVQIIIGICKLGLHKNDKLTVFIGPGYSDMFSDILLNYLDDDTIKGKAKIWSNSYGQPANYLYNTNNYNNVIKSLSNKNYQIFVGSGDNGSTDSDYVDDITDLTYYIRPDQPAMFPYITSVGGTMIYNNIEYPSIIFDDSPNISNNFSSGGGLENVYLKTNGDSEINPYDYINLYKNSQKHIEEYIKAEYTNTDKTIYKGFLKKVIDYSNTNKFYPRAYPDISLSSTNYNIYLNDSKTESYLSAQGGTSASSPLIASIYAIISSNLNLPNEYYGQLNKNLYDAYDNLNWREKVFNPVYSYNKSTDTNGVLYVGDNIQELKAGWGLSQNRLSTNEKATGYGYDCVVGLGSINATELQNYISSTINTSPYINKININNNSLIIEYL
jgi:hypothetical protein